MQTYRLSKVAVTILTAGESFFSSSSNSQKSDTTGVAILKNSVLTLACPEQNESLFAAWNPFSRDQH